MSKETVLIMKLESKLRAESISEAAHERIGNYIERHRHALEYDDDLHGKIKKARNLRGPSEIAAQRTHQIQRDRHASVNWENQSSNHRSI